jgi:hypothetical protein
MTRPDQAVRAPALDELTKDGVDVTGDGRKPTQVTLNEGGN